MALDLKRLSVQAIRERFLAADEPVSPQLLNKLKRDPRQGVRAVYRSLSKRCERQRLEKLRLDALLNFERVLWRSGVQRIAGVDEAGVGPLAGPVVAAAVVFHPDVAIEGVDDSKRLDAAQRRHLAERIRAEAAGVGIGVAEVEEIDRLNVYQAALLAMRRAVEALPRRPQHILVDARTIPGLDIPQNPFNKGDGIDYSIAAASIIAKTYRDALMEDLDRRYPQYGFARHKGYGTTEHQAAIARHGPCPVHRCSYGFIQELQGRFSADFYRLKAGLDRARSVAELSAIESQLEAAAPLLAETEQRKLRTLMQRRWKAV